MTNTKLFRTAILTVSLFFAAMVVGQQHADNTQNINDLLKSKQKIKVVNGSVFANFADQKVTSREIAGTLNKLLKLDENHSFEQISQREDEIGFTHTNFQEFYSGYPVDGRIIMLHEKDGLIKSISGSIAALKNIDIQINITDNQAISIAKENLRVEKVFKETPVQTVFTENQKDKKFYLVKKVRIESFFPLVRYDVFIDAKTGEIIKKISLIHNADVQGTAQTLFYGTQQITCDSRPNGGYRLYDNARKIGTYNGATWNANSYPAESTIYSNTTVNWSNNPALDVHWGMEKTYDYYKNTFNRNSYDGNGGRIYNIYNPVILDEDNYQFNAAAVGDGVMIYGRGDISYGYNPFVALDVAGHEFTHMVTEENGNGGLYYQGESGALNESFSDIFGTCIEFYVGVNPNWLIGEDVVRYKPSMRSMSNPNAQEQPDTYLGNYWADTSSSYDNGGVHINSGVQNFWFYLLCQGGSGVNDLGNNYSVSGIGMEQAQRIAYRNLMNYLALTSNYISSYHGSLQAAEDLFGNPSSQYTAVKQAWYAVGIDETTIGCDFPILLTKNFDTFEDGSGNGNYVDNQDCLWVIAPPCAASVTLSFSAFNTESGYDKVYIFNSYNNYNSNNALAVYSGNNIPNQVTSNTGIMIVRFVTDGSENAAGFTANYTSTEKTNCACKTILTGESGTISDGSGNSNYNDNMQCIWQIMPPNAESITLTFTEFSTEYGYDIVEVRDDVNNISKRFSGNSIPAPVKIQSGKMSVIFVSDIYVNSTGWTAYYTINDVDTDLDEIKDNKIAIFPNPAKNIVNIQFAENQQDAVIEIYDVVGKLVQQFPKQNINANTVQSINIENIPNGIYNINIISNSKKTNHKLIISR